MGNECNFYASPRAGRSMTGLMKKQGRVFWESFQRLTDSLGRYGVYAPNVRDRKAEERLIAAQALTQWIIGQLSGTLPSNASLYDGWTWACGGGEKPSLYELPLEEQLFILQPLRNVDYKSREIYNLLPYFLEVFETGFQAVVCGDGEGKKNRGVYYTPSDVSSFIVSSCAELVFKRSNWMDCSWLDPACGTGAFLIAIIRHILLTGRAQESVNLFEWAKRNLFGFDISPIAIQSAANIISLEIWGSELGSKHLLIDSVSTLRNNFIVTDSTKLLSSKDIGNILPGQSCGVDIVISNPPYTGPSVVAKFLRLMGLVTKPNGAAGMVVPLGVSFNMHKDYQGFRKHVRHSKDNWWFSNFDRTPDSLFGDDIKTRNTIVILEKKADRDADSGSVFSTELIRWNSRNRDKLFTELLTYGRVDKEVLSEYIPKYSGNIATKIFEKMTNMDSELKSILVFANVPGSSEPGIRIAKTAYNWLPVEIFETFDEGSQDNSKYIYATSKTDSISRYVVFAILSSRIAYWWWRVSGDGFHVTKKFIETFPLPPIAMEVNQIRINRMDTLGRSLWKSMQNSKVVSRNAGKICTTYCPHLHMSIVDNIDALLLEMYGLSHGVIEYFRQFVERTIVAGRHMENKDNNIALKRYWEVANEGKHCRN